LAERIAAEAAEREAAMKTWRLTAMMATIVLALGASTARANWQQTGAGPYIYTNAANWSGGTPNGVWPSSLTLGEEQVVEFDSDYTLTTPLLFEHQGEHCLTLRGSGTNRILTLGGDVTANTASIYTGVIFGSTTEGQKLNVALGANRVFASNLQFSRGMAFFNDVTGPYDITKRGPWSLHFSAPTSFSGELKIEQGDVALTYYGALTAVAKVVLGGAVRVDATQAAAILRLDNLSGGLAPWLINVADRLADATPVHARGSSQIVFCGHNSEVAAETIGTYTVESGINQLTCVMEEDGAETKKETTLTITNLVRAAGTALQLQGGGRNAISTTYRNLGQGSGDGNARILATQIDGAAPDAALTNGIIPWAVIGHTPGPSFPWKSFATYGTNGFKPYGYDKDGNLIGGSEPYVTSLASPAATDNVLIDNTATLSGEKTINSLTFAPVANDGFTLGASTADKLTIGSGAIIARNNGSCTFKCTVDFAGQEAIVYANQFWVRFEQNTITNTGGKGLTVPTGILASGTQSYTGPTRILEQGQLICEEHNALPTNTALTVLGSGELAMYFKNITIGSLAGSGIVAFNSGGQGFSAAKTLTVGTDNTSTLFSGNINPKSPGTDNRLTKVGTGTLTLAGTNYYTGATTVSGGGLIVDSVISGSGSDITVASGGTLGGTGLVERVVQVHSGGRLTAGRTDTTGTFTIQTNLLMNAGAKLRVNIAGPTDYDKIVVKGSTVNLNADSSAGAELEIELLDGYEPMGNQTFTIVDKQSVGAVTGAFADETVTVGNVKFSVSYTGGDSNDVVLTVLPRGTVVSIR